MKLIVSSKRLAHKITEAISEGVSTVRCDGKKLIFQSTTKEIDVDVVFKETQSWDVSFDIFMWFEIVKTLQKIPEQPVVVEIFDDFVDISMEYRFKSHKLVDN